jgi:hypothetical protein
MHKDYLDVVHICWLQVRAPSMPSPHASVPSIASLSSDGMAQTRSPTSSPTPTCGTWSRSEIRCLAVGKARVSSTVPCTPILAIGLRIDGQDDMNRPMLQGPSTVCTLHRFYVQYIRYSIVHSTSARLPVFNPIAQGARHGTVHLCLVHSKTPDLSPWSTHAWRLGC